MGKLNVASWLHELNYTFNYLIIIDFQGLWQGLLLHMVALASKGAPTHKN